MRFNKIGHTSNIGNADTTAWWESLMNNIKSVAIALAILVPVLLLGGWIAMTADDGSESECVSCDVVLLNEYPEYRYR